MFLGGWYKTIEDNVLDLIWRSYLSHQRWLHYFFHLSGTRTRAEDVFGIIINYFDVPCDRKRFSWSNKTFLYSWLLQLSKLPDGQVKKLCVCPFHLLQTISDLGKVSWNVTLFIVHQKIFRWLIRRSIEKSTLVVPRQEPTKRCPARAKAWNWKSHVIFYFLHPFLSRHKVKTLSCYIKRRVALPV